MKRIKQDKGYASEVASTDPKPIFKNNYSDMRKAKEIEFDAEGVPKSIEQVIKNRRRVAHSRAERHIIDNRSDIRGKTIDISD